jgi:hypothetical protein
MNFFASVAEGRELTGIVNYENRPEWWRVVLRLPVVWLYLRYRKRQYRINGGLGRFDAHVISREKDA